MNGSGSSSVSSNSSRINSSQVHPTGQNEAEEPGSPSNRSRPEHELGQNSGERPRVVFGMPPPQAGSSEPNGRYAGLNYFNFEGVADMEPVSG